MRNFFSLIALLGVGSSLFAGGVYLVPNSYDNLVLSNASEGYAVINNSTSTFSNNSYVLGGKAVKYRCLKVPKIECAASTPELQVSTSEVSLRTTGGYVIDTWAYDTRIEEDSQNWYICAGAYGGLTKDKVWLEDDGNGHVRVNYQAHADFLEEHLYFCNGDSLCSNDSNSYLAVKYVQVCR